MNSDQTIVTKPQLPEVPGYTVERLLGVGGMAEVFLAKDDQLNRLAAIKMINSAGSMDSDFRQRFEDEARTVAGFNHPNIITVYGFGEVDGKQYIAMSFESGGELDDQLKNGPVEERHALQITAKLAAALAYSHQRDIVHRDIKPANVLFDEAGSPVLSDFGIAKGLNASSGLTQTGMAIGSPAYMSPEQLMGQKIDGKTDVYSLGLVLFQMLNGRLPPNELKMSQDTAVIRKTIEDGLKANGSLQEQEQITDVLVDCLQFDPANRLTAGELAARLQDIEAATSSGNGKWLGMALVGALVLGIIGMATVLFKGPATGTVNFTLTPQGAALILDGVTATARSMQLEAGNHKLIALAPGYQGMRQEFKIAANIDNNVPIALQPLVLPKDSASQLPLFHAQLASNVEPDALDYTDISFPVFLELMRLKAAAADGEEAQSALARQFTEQFGALADQGDILAQIAVVLADNEKLVEINDADRQRYKSAMENSDYPLATFYAGFLLRTEASESGRLDLDKVRRYKVLLEKAQARGFSLADNFIAEAAGLLEAGE